MRAGMVGKIHVKLYETWTSGLGDVHRFSYLRLWRLFCSAERNHLCNFGRGNQEDQFSEIISNVDQWFRRCHLKDLIWSSGSPPVRWSGTICAILEEGIMGNTHMKLYEIWTSGLGDVV